ncbi:MAG: PAS domain S-box protein [Alphaproteobacteria bacterium]|nr:PAS domain S-box protein [Alphaproteobacteria bacterium]
MAGRFKSSELRTVAAIEAYAPGFVLLTKRALFVGAAVYAFYAVMHILLLPPALGAPMFAAAAATCAAFLALHAALGRNLLPDSILRRTMAIVFGFVWFNSALLLVLSGDSNQSTNLALTMIGAATLLIDDREFYALVAACWVAWAAALAASQEPGPWLHYAFFMLTASVLAGMISFWKTTLIAQVHERREQARNLREMEKAVYRSDQETLAAVAASHDRFRDFANSSADWFWETDAEGRITAITAGAQATSMIDHTKFLGAHMNTFKPPGMSDLEFERRIKAFADRKPYRDNHWDVVDAAGRVRTLSGSAAPAFDQTGTFVGFRGTTRDVTPEVEARAAVAAAEHRLLEAIEAAPGGLTLVGKDGRFLGSNKTARDARLRNGQTAEPGDHYADVLEGAARLVGLEVPDMEATVTGAQVYARLAACGPPFEARVGKRWYLVRGTRLSDGTLVVGSPDITDLKLREAELTEAKAAAETASRHKTEFLATMSHELRNPLTSIIGSLGVILGNPGGALPPKVERLIGIALNNSRRLVGLINEILDVEKIEAGIASFDVRSIKFVDVVREAITVMNGAATQRRVKLALDPDSPHDVVRADKDRLVQVVINLLSNAIKFSPEGGEVAVSLRKHATRLRLSVSDSGPGIAPAFQARMFKRFAQAEQAKGEGSGLGLAIARSIVVHLGGEISFETKEGAGTTFHVELPLAAGEVQEVAA